MTRQAANGPLRKQNDLVILADLDGTMIERGADVPDGGGELVAFAQRSYATLIVISARPVDELARQFVDCSPIKIVVGSGGGVVARVEGGVIKTILREIVLTSTQDFPLLRALTTLRSSAVLFAFGAWKSSFRVSVLLQGGHLSHRALSTIIGTRPWQIVADHEFHSIVRHEQLLGVSVLSESGPDLLLDHMVGSDISPGWRWAVYPEYRFKGHTWLEILPQQANKASAADFVLTDILGVKGPDTVVAIGDSPEDIGMFTLASRSFCPNTAASQVLEAASTVISSKGGPEFIQALVSRLERETSSDSSNAIRG